MDNYIRGQATGRTLTRIFKGRATGREDAWEQVERTFGRIVAVDHRGRRRLVNIPAWCTLIWLDPFETNERRYIVVREN